MPVDFLVRTADEWRVRFAPDRVGDESWGYAFLDGVILRDPDGIVARLVADAADIHEHYRTDPGMIADMRHRFAQWRRELLAADPR